MMIKNYIKRGGEKQELTIIKRLEVRVISHHSRVR